MKGQHKPESIFSAAQQILEGDSLGDSSVSKEKLNEDYIESMGDEFDDGLALIIKAWLKWKKGPMTEPKDIKPARKEVLDFIARKIN